MTISAATIERRVRKRVARAQFSISKVSIARYEIEAILSAIDGLRRAETLRADREGLLSGAIPSGCNCECHEDGGHQPGGCESCTKIHEFHDARIAAAEAKP